MHTYSLRLKNTKSKFPPPVWLPTDGCYLYIAPDGFSYKDQSHYAYSGSTDYEQKALALFPSATHLTKTDARFNIILKRLGGKCDKLKVYTFLMTSVAVMCHNGGAEPQLADRLTIMKDELFPDSRTITVIYAVAIR